MSPVVKAFLMVWISIVGMVCIGLVSEMYARKSFTMCLVQSAANGWAAKDAKEACK